MTDTRSPANLVAEEMRQIGADYVGADPDLWTTAEYLSDARRVLTALAESPDAVERMAGALSEYVTLPDDATDWSDAMLNAYENSLDFGTGRRIARKILVRDAATAALASLTQS